MMMPSKLRVVSRPSPLALIQARGTIRILQSLSPRTEIELTPISSGETPKGWEPGQPLPESSSEKGGFVQGVRQELLAGRADLAVHSAKDVPIEQTNGLRIVATLPRIDPRDALITAIPSLTDSARVAAVQDGLEESPNPFRHLPAGSRIGTSSPRRAAFLRHLAPHCTVIPMRGNVDTRVRHLLDGRCDALILAMAGLRRLRLIYVNELETLSAQPFDPVPVGTGPESTPGLLAYPLGLDLMVPSPGQGILALEAPLNTAYGKLWAQVDHGLTSEALRVERQLAASLDATCSTALGIHVRWVSPNSVNGPGWEIRIQWERSAYAQLEQVRVVSPRANDAANQALAQLRR
jgi:hydroxymethylbilane synthase